MEIYRCIIDNEFFETKEDLIKHLLDTHSINQILDIPDEIKQSIKDIPNIKLMSLTNNKFLLEIYNLRKDRLLISQQINFDNTQKFITPTFTNVEEFKNKMISINEEMNYIEQVYSNMVSVEKLFIEKFTFGFYGDSTDVLTVVFEIRGKKYTIEHQIGDREYSSNLIGALVNNSIEGELKVGKYPYFDITVAGIRLEDFTRNNETIKVILVEKKEAAE